MGNISLIGWLHTLFSVGAMIAGGVALFARKGSVDHKKWGLWFVYSMVLTNLTALLVYRIGGFNVFHWMAIGTLAAVLLGWYAAPRQRSLIWANTHLTCMIWSYYMLYGGLLNELFLRVPAFRNLSPFFGANGMIFGMLQMLTMLFFIVLWLVYLTRTFRQFKRRSRQGQLSAGI